MKNSLPAPPNFSPDQRSPLQHSSKTEPRHAEVSSLTQAVKAGRTVVQLLHGMAHIGRLGPPASHSSSASASLPNRARELHRLCKSLLEHLEVRTEMAGSLPEQGMLVTNHVSFLDIMFLGSLKPMVFVSKSEVATWPLVGTIASSAGTLYVDRGRRSAVARVNESLTRAINEGVLVTLFPEGTSSDGTGVLPFQPSLLQPAVDAGIPICPGHLRYVGVDGNPADDVAYFGDRELLPCLLALLSRKRLTASLRCGNPVPPGADRKTLSTSLRSEVLRLSSEHTR